jgi:hypothetical protein
MPVLGRGKCLLASSFDHVLACRTLFENTESALIQTAVQSAVDHRLYAAFWTMTTSTFGMSRYVPHCFEIYKAAPHVRVDQLHAKSVADILTI